MRKSIPGALTAALISLSMLAALAAPAGASPINAAPKVVGGGSNDSCLISQMGVLYCAGDNVSGMIGPKNSGTFNPVDAMTPVPSAPVIDGSLAYNHGCVIVVGGVVQCRGSNYYGQLSGPTNLGTVNANPDPVTVPLPAAATRVATAQGYSCAVIVSGAVYCWGVNNSGQLGTSVNANTYQPNPTPMLVALPGSAVDIATAAFHACALLTSGQTYCWGMNFYGQLASNTNTGAPTTNLPLLAANFAPASSLGIGTSHTCVVSRSGTADCAGINQYGQLASSVNNNTGNANPAPFSAQIQSQTALQVVGEGDATCVLSTSGAVFCFGDNYDGQLGNATDHGSDVAHPIPVAVAGLPSATAIGAGYNFACAALSNGSAACWGNNGSGQLGQPVAIAQSTAPLVVPGVNLLDAPAPIALSAGKLRMKFRKSGKKIRATATIKFSGPIALDAAHCAGTLSASFNTSKKVKKKTRSKRVAKASPKLALVGGACRAKLSAKLPKSTRGKRIKLKIALPGFQVYGAADVQPFAKSAYQRVPRHLR